MDLWKPVTCDFLGGQSVRGGGLIIILFYLGGFSNYLLRGSANYIPMETRTFTVHM